MKQVLYAIGDVHGRDDLLAALHDRIAAHYKSRHEGTPATLIHLGDYIDRGSDSLAVIDRLIAGNAGFQVICLKGNHEAMMLDCLNTDNQQTWWTWLANGGDRTLESLGVSLRFGDYDCEQLAEALGAHRIAWLRSLPLYFRSPAHLFVHAGIVPERPLDRQEEKDLLWIRHRFLDYEGDHGCCVIHGHTPSKEPVVRQNRICIDTGATVYGKLTAVALADTEEPYFLTVEESLGTDQKR